MRRTRQIWWMRRTRRIRRTQQIRRTRRIQRIQWIQRIWRIRQIQWIQQIFKWFLSFINFVTKGFLSSSRLSSELYLAEW